MKTYKFPNFNAEITDPQILSVSWSGNSTTTVLSVGAVLVSPDGSKFGVNIGEYDYSQNGNCSPQSIMDWAILELEKFKVS